MPNQRAKAISTLPLTCAAILMTAAPAMAQDSEEFKPKGGLYISVAAGVSVPNNSEFSGVQAPVAPSPGMPGAPANADVNFGTDFTAQGAIGYRFATRFLGVFQPSVELEYNYASASVSSGAFNGGNQTFGGDFDIDSYSLNYQSDIRWSNGQRVIPFLGSGIGIADIRANILYFPNNGVATAPTFGVIGNDTAFTLQSNAGVRFVLTDSIELQARARYQRIRGLDFERRFIAGSNNAFNAQLEGNYDSFNFLAGVRYNF